MVGYNINCFSMIFISISQTSMAADINNIVSLSSQNFTECHTPDEIYHFPTWTIGKNITSILVLQFCYNYLDLNVKYLKIDVLLCNFLLIHSNWAV